MAGRKDLQTTLGVQLYLDVMNNKVQGAPFVTSARSHNVSCFPAADVTDVYCLPREDNVTE